MGGCVASRIRRFIAVLRSPAKVIGSCLHCGDTVTYAAGDTDRNGCARHDTCERGTDNAATADIQARQGFTLAITRLAKDATPQRRVVIRNLVSQLPEQYGPRDMLSVLEQLEQRFRSDSKTVHEAISRLRAISS